MNINTKYWEKKAMEKFCEFRNGIFLVYSKTTTGQRGGILRTIIIPLFQILAKIVLVLSDS